MFQYLGKTGCLFLPVSPSSSTRCGDFEEFIYGAAIHAGIDQTFGALTILLVLEASRRTTGSILPTVAVMTLEGIFGVPLDVTVTFIISSRSMVPCWNIQVRAVLCRLFSVSDQR